MFTCFRDSWIEVLVFFSYPGMITSGGHKMPGELFSFARIC